MEFNKAPTSEIDWDQLEKLKKRLIIGRQQLGYIDSDRPNVRLQGLLFRSGFNQEGQVLNPSKNPLEILRIRLTSALAIAVARSSMYDPNDITSTVDSGRQFARDAHKYHQLTGRTLEDIRSEIIFNKLVRSGKIKI